MNYLRTKNHRSRKRGVAECRRLQRLVHIRGGLHSFIHIVPHFSNSCQYLHFQYIRYQIFRALRFLFSADSCYLRPCTILIFIHDIHLLYRVLPSSDPAVTANSSLWLQFAYFYFLSLLVFFYLIYYPPKSVSPTRLPKRSYPFILPKRF